MNKIRPQPSISALRNHIVAMARSLRQASRPDGETWTGLMALGAIQRGNGEATPSQIALELELRSSNVAHVLNDLEERGLIARQQDPSDKRKVRLALTTRGRTLVKETRADRDHWLAEAMANCLNKEECAQLLAAGDLIGRVAASAHNYKRR